jgi:hypothetical protein
VTNIKTPKIEQKIGCKSAKNRPKIDQRAKKSAKLAGIGDCFSGLVMFD